MWTSAGAHLIFADIRPAFIVVHAVRTGFGERVLIKLTYTTTTEIATEAAVPMAAGFALWGRQYISDVQYL